MQISLNIILDKLSGYRMETHLPLPSDRKFNREEILPAVTAEMNSNRLYLGRLSQVIALPAENRKDNVFICLRDRIRDDGETEEIMQNTIVVNENISFESLIALVQDVFYEIESWHEAVQKALIQNQSLQDLMDLSESVLQNYIQITDSSFKLLAYTRNIACDEEVTVLARKYGYHPEKTVEQFRKNRRMEAWSKANGLLVNDDHTFLKYTTVSKIFRFSNTYFAHVVMTCNNRPATAGTKDLFLIFIDILSVFIEKEWNNTNNWHHIYDPFLMDIYEGNVTSRDVAEERARHVGLPLNGCFCLSLTLPEESGKYSLGQIAQEIAAVRPNDRITLFNGRVVILSLFSEKNFPEQFGQTRTDLESIMERFDLRCGMSAIFKDLLLAQRAVQQARQALAYSGRNQDTELIPALEGGLSNLQKRVAFFEDNFFYILLGNNPDNQAIWQGSVYYKALNILQQYDKQHNQNNLELLYVYLINECRPTDTGNILHMSRNNVVYRIGRIGEMLKLDLNSASVRFKLMISFILAQMYGLE